MNYHSLLLITPLLLVACSSTAHTPSLQENLGNPYYAQRYYTDLSELMVSLDIDNDPLLKDANKKGIVDRTRTQAAKKAEDAIKMRDKGLQGNFISDRDLLVGAAAVLNGNVFFSPEFQSAPGPSLHVYLSDSVDPRQGIFPQATDVDLGLLANPYGAQQYAVPGKAASHDFRTLVIWDNALGMPYGFVQLKKIGN